MENCNKLLKELEHRIDELFMTGYDREVFEMPQIDNVWEVFNVLEQRIKHIQWLSQNGREALINGTTLSVADNLVAIEKVTNEILED